MENILINFIDKITYFIKWIFSIIVKKFFTKTVKIITAANQNLATWWHVGSQGNIPIMQIHGEFLATNISNVDIRLVKIVSNKCKPEKIITQMLLINDPRKQIYSAKHAIPPRETIDVVFDIIYQDILQAKGKAFKAKIYIRSVR